MRLKGKIHLLAGRAAGLLCVLMTAAACMLDGPELEQKFSSTEEMNLSVKGKVIAEYDPYSWQIGYSPSLCEFKVCNDSMSEYYTLRCNRLPSGTGDVLTCDIEWTTYSDIKNKKKLEFKVVKEDLSTGTFWLWCSSARIGAAVRKL